ncbi:MAG: glycosyltransferase family 2 protein [Acidobacteria bacterium]|nr:glycosyltransferase family 2 protein [Acidobacteriota bacterium]
MSGARRPAISVVIPTYNRSALLEQAIASVLAQSLAPTQVLVVDDGSTDSTTELLERLRPQVQSMGVPHGGKSSALNAALKEVSGDYVWIFDDDDIALPDALERFVEPLEKDPALGFSYSHYWYTPGLEDGRLAAPKGSSRIPDTHTRGLLVPLLEFNFLSGAALFARTSCYSAVGGFDPSLTRSQEYEMAIRIARRFRGAQVSGGPTFHLRQHPGTRGSQSDRFAVNAKKQKWLEYDQKIFRHLHTDLQLEEYLAPGLDVDTHRRMALLQRAVIMAGKSLFAEAVTDLTEIADGPDQSPLLSDEVRLVREGLAARPFYGGGIRSDPPSLAALKRLSRRSEAMRAICAHLRASMVRELAGESGSLMLDAIRGRRADVRVHLIRAGRVVKQLTHMSGVARGGDRLS